MSSRARARAGRRLAVGVASILLPALLLGYVGVRALAERSNSLRATYTATTALVRDRLVTELTSLESALAMALGRPAARLEEPASARAWLHGLAASTPWLAEPFLLDGGAVTTSDLVAGGSRPNPLSARPGMIAALREAEAAEFVDGRLDLALAKYRQAIRSASSDAARGFVLMRVGRTLFKLRRFEEGIAEYRAVLALSPGTLDPHGIPYAVNALLEIVDGLEALGLATETPAHRLRLLQLIVDHPWDADGGYHYYLSRAVESAPASAAGLRARGGELTRAAASIQWIQEEVRPRVEEDLTSRGWNGLTPRRFVVRRDDRSVPIGCIPIPDGSGDRAPTVLGYAIRPEYVAGPLVAAVLKTVDLGGGLRIEVVNEHDVSRARSDKASGPTALALAGLETVLPGWSVGLFHRDGRSIDQIARRDRWIYGAPIVAMVVVLIVGVAMTLRASAREAELSRLKTEFVANASHELKTPLALIRMFGETLESGIVTDEAKRQEFYAIIRRESDRLTHLINNVLDVARIDAGTKQYAIAADDVVALVREAIDAYQPLLDRLGFAVGTVLPNSPVLVSMDRDAIAQALVNLFQNAIKYSGDVKQLEVSVVVAGATVRLSVADRGIGIVPAEIPRIFEKHYRIRSAAPGALSANGGSGLGLSIVKHAIEAHGGQVEVVSAPERGSTFTLVLPIRAAA
jgi:signal transduction histidine kinase/tetratricopeptide (TPR) repeat protein